MKSNIHTVITVCVIFHKNAALTTNRLQENVETCGISSIKSGLIVHGEYFARGTFPWIVALMHTGWNPPKFICGGTLISKTYVISGNMF